jgi:hypothetical protein
MALLAILIVTALAQALPSKTESINDKLIWVKAICNKDNYCIDVKITCDGGELIDIEPIPDGVYFSSGWKDPRPEDFMNSWCE